LLVMIMYFTYCQLWIADDVMGFFEYVKSVIGKKQVTWYKTERF